MNEFEINILKQLKEKPTIVNDIDTIEEAYWLLDSLDKAIEALREQRPHGHWIERELYDKDPFKRNKIIVCSNCDTAHKIISDDLKWFDFCPNCGADMREVKTDANSD